MEICQCVSVGSQPEAQWGAPMGRVLVLRNTSSLADAEKHASYGLARSLGMFPHVHVTLLSTRFPCLSGALFSGSSCSRSKRFRTNYDSNNRQRLIYLSCQYVFFSTSGNKIKADLYTTLLLDQSVRDRDCRTSAGTLLFSF
jgi:hypothetical protein